MAQIRNPELVRNLTPDFHKRSDLALNHAHSIAFMRSVPGLVGFWPAAERDISGNGNTLTRSGTLKTIGYDNNIVPYAQFDDSGSAYSFHADSADFDITGTESYVDSGYKGLTMGGWWQVSGSGGDIEHMMGKWELTPNKAYGMWKRSIGDSEVIASAWSEDGSNQFDSYSTFTADHDTWFFFVFRWTPSTEVKSYYGYATEANLTTESDTSSIAASINNSAEEFQIGRLSLGFFNLDGRSSMTFLVRGALPDIYIETFFDLTSPLFSAT